ncbi:MAG: 4-phosphoerythronate dehydrogenase [Bacteroidales bacterium]|jgi:erythronate-4-phosphate dehydrogenase|nr:4-phosphoerythronate dehydrogenase [Bacteroidales bacterium]
MKKPTIIADHKIPFLKGSLENVANVIYMPGNEISNAVLQNADALLIRTRTKCNKDLLKDTSVKFIASATIGHDHIDTEYCKANGIEWINAPGCNAASVEQYIVSALLEIANQFKFDLKVKTLGIIGVGHVGIKVANAAIALGMNVLLNDPPRKRNENLENFVDLSIIQKEADIISCHVLLNSEGEDKTLNMADELFFNKLKKGCILINTSRGEIIDENDLEKAIDEKILSATVLDVWRNEPSINLSLLKKTTLATPHIAGYSANGKAKGTEMSVQAISKFFNLGLSNWKPENIPQPTQPQIRINCQNKTEQEIVYEIYKHTYNILADNLNLKRSPYLFEILRENYPLRREAKAYNLSFLGACSETIFLALKHLGFRIQI